MKPAGNSDRNSYILMKKTCGLNILLSWQLPVYFFLRHAEM
jgi:hypothetical protein